MSFTVAIDGPAAAGKGTIAAAVARHFGFQHLDTGLLYRAVGRAMLDGADPIRAARGLRHDEIDAALLRSADVAQAASQVAALPDVRAALVAFQQAFAAHPHGAVLDGRDIGTVICPTAEAKLFVTASVAVRAARRHRELLAKGEDMLLAEVAEDVAARDARDRERATAPLKPAEDAVLIDTSDLSIAAAVARAIDAVAAKRG